MNGGVELIKQYRGVMFLCLVFLGYVAWLYLSYQYEKYWGTNEVDFESYVSVIDGSSFIENAYVKDDIGVIEFYPSYETYKKEKVASSLTINDYQDYFNTGDKIEKIFVGETVRLLRQFPNLKGVAVTLSLKQNTYFIDLSREEANNYLGLNIEDLSTEDGSWREQFVNKTLSDDTLRQDFFDKFVVVKPKNQNTVTNDKNSLSNNSFKGLWEQRDGKIYRNITFKDNGLAYMEFIYEGRHLFYKGSYRIDNNVIVYDVQEAYDESNITLKNEIREMDFYITKFNKNSMTITAEGYSYDYVKKE